MLDILVLGIIIGCLASWFITLSNKRGWRTTWQTNAPNDTIWHLLECDYCMSWWSSLAMSIVAAIAFGNAWLLVAAFVGTMTSKKLLE